MGLFSDLLDAVLGDDSSSRSDEKDRSEGKYQGDNRDDRDGDDYTDDK
ncbi:MAG TPA: hypothetical protein VEK36_01380 [Candidatus Paceibacterota bacterium]|nr:hypothetical protein [Candidatus Paceibacterota bacterium]